VEDERQQLERELSSLRSDLVEHNQEAILLEQKRKVCITIIPFDIEPYIEITIYFPY
jgi:hypothetical protein